ncbi:MAG TPA: nitroreductase family protein [Candidatus Nitrosopolaris sp.]|nr:nitroreductase family protein [Candidatus Nitrosopolaris sp.]
MKFAIPISTSKSVGFMKPLVTTYEYRSAVFYIIRFSMEFRKALRYLVTNLVAEEMDTFECITTKLEVREFSNKDIPFEIRAKVLEAARSTGTGLNTQHWRFILVIDKQNLKKLAEDSTSGSWVRDANFAVIVLTNPEYNFHLIDAGRVLQNMQLAAWNHEVCSGLFTGIRAEKLRSDFGIPNELSPTVIVGFGYPARKLTGKSKKRMLLDKLVYYEKYGNSKIHANPDSGR